MHLLLQGGCSFGCHSSPPAPQLQPACGSGRVAARGKSLPPTLPPGPKPLHVPHLLRSVHAFCIKPTRWKTRALISISLPPVPCANGVFSSKVGVPSLCPTGCKLPAAGAAPQGGCSSPGGWGHWCLSYCCGRALGLLGRLSFKLHGLCLNRIRRLSPLHLLLAQVEGNVVGGCSDFALLADTPQQASPGMPRVSLPLSSAVTSADRAGNGPSGQRLLRKLGLPQPHAEPRPWLCLCSPRPALPGETSLRASRISLLSFPCSHEQPQDKSQINKSSSSRAGNSWLLWQLGLLGICIRLMIFIAQPHLRQAGEISIFPAPSQLGRGGGQEGDI